MGASCLQATPKVSLTKDELDYLTKRTQDGGTEVVQAKAGKVGNVVSSPPRVLCLGWQCLYCGACCYKLPNKQQYTGWLC